MDAVLEAGNVLLRIVAQSVIEVESEVTSPQLRVLVLIARSGSQTLGAIAGELAVHPSNATRTCDRLVARGMVQRLRSVEDRRLRRIDLTTAGRTLVESVLAHRREAVTQVLRMLGTDAIAESLSALRLFAVAADNIGITDGRFALSLTE